MHIDAGSIQDSVCLFLLFPVDPQAGLDSCVSPGWAIVSFTAAFSSWEVHAAHLTVRSQSL